VSKVARAAWPAVPMWPLPAPAVEREDIGCVILVSHEGGCCVLTPREALKYFERTSGGIPKNARDLHNHQHVAWCATEALSDRIEAMRRSEKRGNKALRVSSSQARAELAAYQAKHGASTGFYKAFYALHPGFPRASASGEEHRPLKDLLRDRRQRNAARRKK
jgi:hypothetical protein